jgi:hypothetical protein
MDIPGQFRQSCVVASVWASGRTGNDSGIRWFCAPDGHYTRMMMEQCLPQRGLKNAMRDAYVSCRIVRDGQWIGVLLARNDQDQDGSIGTSSIPGCDVERVGASGPQSQEK